MSGTPGNVPTEATKTATAQLVDLVRDYPGRITQATAGQILHPGANSTTAHTRVLAAIDYSVKAKHELGGYLLLMEATIHGKSREVIEFEVWQ